ncbi:MAG: hypothetical protein KDB16_18780, partial [Acidimicrobiales bacterium]|nr:hypothetical protein [Acidimicrobiales bacterium]
SALSAAGSPGTTFDSDSIRVYEVDGAGAVVAGGSNVAFQFDRGDGYNATNNASGQMVLLLTSTTSTQRHYQVYFRTTASSGSYTPVDHSGLGRVSMVTNTTDQGRAAYRITNSTAQWWYDTAGGGFSSIVAGGDDWINWSTATGSAGMFRGLPNLEYPDTQFHPGHDVAVTSVQSQGPLRAVFTSTSLDGKWKVRWSIFKRHATMELLKTPAGADYWFLYEGTPGGTLEASDTVIRSNGATNGALATFTGDVAAPEWVAVADSADGRAIWIANLDDDSAADSYRDHEDAMTVLGLGRNGLTQTMTGLRTFAVGMVDQAAYAGISPLVEAATSPISVSLGGGVPLPTTTTTTTSTTTTTTSTTTTTTTSTTTTTVAPSLEGYAVVTSTGVVYPFGEIQNLGNANTTSALALALHPSGNGYWILDQQGRVFAFGSASDLGDLEGALGAGERATTIAVSPNGSGYWIVTSLGRVVGFGTAGYHGDATGLNLAGDIIDAAATPTGLGYYLVGSDGGIFAFGDAKFAGSVPQVLPGVTLDGPVVGITPDPDGTGYWLVASDGGVFAFGAGFRGSIPQVLPAGGSLDQPINGMVPYGTGYLLVASDGGVFNFSDRQFQGSIADLNLADPITAIDAT